MLIFELKTEAKSFIIWTISLLFTFIAFMYGIFPTFSDSLDSIKKVLENYPPAFVAAFGFEIDTMFSFSGFYTFTFNYLVLIGAIMAVAISVATFSREKRSKCGDFLLTKPISRRKIFVTKLLSDLSILAATNVIFVCVGMILFASNKDNAISVSTFALCLSSIFFTQLVFLGFGVFFATFSRKVRSVSTTAITFGFGAFFLSALANITNDEKIKLFSPLKYFDPYSLITGDFFEGKYIFMAVVLFVSCIILAFAKYCKSDVHSV